jgi:hypothetical protein
MTIEERRNEIWGAFDQQAELVQEMRSSYAPWNNNLADDYQPVEAIWYERGVTGCEGDPRIKETFVSLEYMIESLIGYERI